MKEPRQKQLKHGDQNSFQTIYQRRIIELESQVNKHCAEYDAFMALLPLGNHFSSVINFQPEIDQAPLIINTCNEKVSMINNSQIHIDHRHWANELKKLESLLEKNQAQLRSIAELHHDNNDLEEDAEFEQQLNGRFEQHRQAVMQKLAGHKNAIDLKRHKQSIQDYSCVQRLIDQRLEEHFGPCHKELDEIQQQLEALRLRIPRRDISKFYSFNYHRILDEILCLNEELEKMFGRLHLQTPQLDSKIMNKIQSISLQIESIQNQIDGLQNKCQLDTVTSNFRQNGSPQNQLNTQFSQGFTQLRNGLNQVSHKFNSIIAYIHSI